MRKAKRARPNATGRNAKRTGSGDAVIILRRSFWLSPQVSALSVTARALLVELTAMYTGPRCNSGLFLSVRDAQARLGLGSKATAANAINELIDIGLLTPSQAGHFAMKVGGKSKARGFRLNWKDAQGAPTSAAALLDLDFERLSRVQKRRVERRSRALSAFTKEQSAVPTTGTLAAIRAAMAEEDVPEIGTS